MNIREIYFLILFSVVSQVFAQSRRIEFTEYDLPNGLHVILHRRTAAPVVAVSVLYHVGSKNENPDRTGFAHFFEHLLFEGSKNIKRGEFSKYVQNAGGQLNAFTTNDITYYFEILPSNQLELALWLESERMLHATVTKEGIETQRKVVKEERRQRIENVPYGNWIEEMFSRAYKKHPYRWPVIGSMRHLNAAKEEDYINFYKTYYVPNNAVLTVVGDIDIETTKSLIAKYFTEIPRGNEIVRPSPSEEPLTKEIRATFEEEVPLPQVFYGYRIPEQTHPDAPALEILAAILSGGESSRLNRELVEKQELAGFVECSPFLLEHPGLMLFIANGANPDIASLEKVEKALDKQIEEICTSLVEDKELERVKNQYEILKLTGFDGVAQIAQVLAESYVLYKNTDRINTYAEPYLKVTAEDILRVAKKYLRKENRVVLRYLPKI